MTSNPWSGAIIGTLIGLAIAGGSDPVKPGKEAMPESEDEAEEDNQSDSKVTSTSE